MTTGDKVVGHFLRRTCWIPHRRGVTDKFNLTPPTPASSKKAGFTHEAPTGKSDEWFTPPSIFTSIGLTFDLDPCSPGADRSYVPARHHYTIHDDGLTSSWFGTVFVNPPYSDVKTWMLKLADHGDGIGLVFNRTDTVWFQAALAKATLVCFMARRIPFIEGRTGKVKGNPGTGSALFAYGETAAQALLQSGLGHCVRPVKN